MQKSHNTMKVFRVCLSLGIVVAAGTVTPSLSRTESAPSFAPRLVTGDGQETHGGKGGIKPLRLIAGDGQETHGGGKGTA